MQIDGESIFLRPVQKEDLPFFVEWLSDSEVNQFTTSGSSSLKKELKWLKKMENDPKEQAFSILLKSTEKIIGCCGIHFKQRRIDEYDGKNFTWLMIGKKSEWGKGYGTDVVKTLLKYLKDELGEKEIYLTVFCDNLAAIRVYEKCGFKIVEKRKAPERPTEDEYVMKVMI